MLPELGRIILYTKKIEQMAAFYAGHFGYLVRRDPVDRLVELTSPTSGMTILLHPAAVSQKEGQVMVKLVFDVEDVVTFCATARANGLELEDLHQADGYVFANAKDPSGSAIQVSSRAFAAK